MALIKKSNVAPTVEEIESDIITQLSGKYWAPFSNVPRLPFNCQIIEDIYNYELFKTKFSTKRIMLLEFSQYLENYLWPNYTKGASKAHILSIVIIVNEKYRERVLTWESFKSRPDIFVIFFHDVMYLSSSNQISFPERTILVMFFIHCCNSLGDDFIRKQFLKLVTLMTWTNIIPSYRDNIFASNPMYKNAWRKLNKTEAALKDEQKQLAIMHRNFIYERILHFFNVLDFMKPDKINEDESHYCERMLEFIIDLEAQLPTRRFLNTLFQSMNVVVKCRLSVLHSDEKLGLLFRQLLEMLSFYTGFEIDDQLGEALTEREMSILHYNKINSLQKAVFKHFEELKRFSLANIASIDTRKSLLKHFSELSNEKLCQLASYLNMIPQMDDDDAPSKKKKVPTANLR